MGRVQGLEQRSKVGLHIRRPHFPEEFLFIVNSESLQETGLLIYPKVLMPIIWQNGNNLVLTPECSDERTYGFTTFEIIEQFKLVLYSDWTAGDVDFLNSNISRPFGLWGCSVPLLRRDPECGIWRVHIPIIVVVFIK